MKHRHHSSRSLDAVVALVTLLGVGACTPKPPPPPPPPPPPVAPEPPPPPPPPKCEALEEGCLAKTGQRLTIHPIEWTVEPPAGWKYAVSGDAVTAESDAAVLVIKTFDVPAEKTTAAMKVKNTKRDETLSAILEELKLARPKKLSFGAKPQKSSKVDKVDVALYQFDGSKRADEPGPLLVVLAQPATGHMLVGVAFVAERDTTSADVAVLHAISSLAPAAEAGDAGSPAAK